MIKRFSFPVLMLFGAGNLPAQDYGGGWGVPSLDVSTSITNTVIATELGMRAAGIGSASRPTGRQTRPTQPPAPLLFTAALDARPASSVQTSFTRSAAVSRQAQQGILQAIAALQPDAVPHYKRAFASSDMARAFNSIVSPYGLSANDAADALTSYWVMAWVVANKASLPSPEGVRAARAQVVSGFARTGAGGDATRRQILADEAIFNFLVLNGAWRQVSSGSPPDYQRLSDATQRNFVSLGADLRSLTLGRRGFARR